MITDFSMPRMNGAELARAVRELVPALPILIATGYADLPPGSGIDLPRISKPYTQAQLAKEIARLLS
jgi:CheY-like chemotaxis protein